MNKVNPPSGSKRFSKERRARLGAALVVFGLVLIAFATLRPVAGAVADSSTFCIVCGSLGGVDVVLNVALFVPFGAGLALLLPRRLAALAVVASTSFVVEALQFRLIPGRDASVGDLVTNALGGIVGLALVAAWAVLALPGRQAARALALVSAVAVSVVLAFSGWALQPSMPLASLWGQYAPPHRMFAPFPGRVLSITLNGVTVRQGDYHDARWGKDALTGDTVRVVARVVPGGATPRLSAIGRFANYRFEGFLIGQTGRDLVFRTRMRAADLRLRVPQVALRNALPSANAALDPATGATNGRSNSVAPLELLGLRRGNVLGAAVAGPSQHGFFVPLSPALGWAFFLPFDFSLGPGYRYLSAIWIAALVFPVAYWSTLGFWRQRMRPLASGGETARGIVASVSAPAAALVLGLVVSELQFHLPAPHWSELAAGAAGILAGVLLARRMRIRGNPDTDRRDGSP